MFVFFVRYIFGYVHLIFSGEFCERILNLAAQNGATLWDIKKCDDNIISAKMSVKNFKKIRKIRAKSGVKVKLVKKVGLPFVFRKHSKRMGFILGVIVFFFILNFLSNFIWKIEVSGNEKIKDDIVLSACNQLGIYEGVNKRKFDFESAKEKLILSLNGVAWASLNVEGCRLTVEISEITNNFEAFTAPSNLFAKVDGVIKRVDVKSGNCHVKVGDAVVKGDMLVSGKTEFKESGVTKLTQSKAEIVAQTKRIFKVTVKKTQVENVLKDKKIVKKVLVIFGVKIPLYLGETRLPYNVSTSDFRVKLFDENLPIEIITKEFSPLKKIEKNLSSEEAVNLGRQTIKNIIENGEYIAYSLIKSEINETENEIILTETYNCEENIVYEVKMQENILQ